MIKKFQFFLVIILLVLIWDNSVYAQDFNQIALLQKEVAENPKNTLAHFNLGVSFHKDKQFKKAAYHYRQVIKSKSPLRPIALYYISRLYKDLGNIKKAKKAINLINVYDLPQKFKAKISDYKSELFQVNAQEVKDISTQEVTSYTQSPKRFSGSFNLAYGLNSNPQYIAADDTTTSTESEGQLNASLILNYLTAIGDTYDLGIGYSGYTRNYSQSADSNYGGHSLNLPINFYSSKYRLQFSPSYSFQTYSGKEFSSMVSGLLELKRKIESSYLSIGFTYDSINSLDEDYYYLEGDTLGPYLQWQYLWSSASLTLSYGYYDNNFVDNSSVSASYVSHNLQSTLVYRLLTNWSVTTSIGFQNRTYTFDQTENDIRKDARLSLAASLNYNISYSTQIYINLNTINNTSNFDSNNTDDKNYSQSSGNLGLNWQF